MDRAWRTLAARKNIPVRQVTAGDTLNFGSGIGAPVIGAARPEVVAPNCQNNNSIVFRLVYGDFAMLFTGDQGFEEEDAILASGAAVASDVLKAGHHAGAGSTGEKVSRPGRAENCGGDDAGMALRRSARYPGREAVAGRELSVFPQLGIRRYGDLFRRQGFRSGPGIRQMNYRRRDSLRRVVAQEKRNNVA